MSILKPLEPLRESLVVLSGLWAKAAEPPEDATGSDYFVAAAFLTANKPKKTSGSDRSVGSASIDQTIARAIGRDSMVPSLQLAVEDPNQSSGNCGQGYSCWYTNTISWSDASTPMEMELRPQAVFEKLFGPGATPAERAARRQQSRSILDDVVLELVSLKRNLGPGDRRIVDGFTEDVRDVERRIQSAAQTYNRVPALDQPIGNPETYDARIKLHYDLLTLAFQADITRVATMMGARDYTGASYPLPQGDLFPNGGTSASFHGSSRHQDDPKQIARFAEVNRYHVSTMSYLAQKLHSIPEGDGTLLDHALILYGTDIGNSNSAQHYDVGHFLVGGINGQLKGGRHLAYPQRTVTTGNVLLSVLDMYGVHQERQGDSTGRLAGL